MTWYWLHCAALTFGLTACDEIVRVAAPVARWCVGRPLVDVLGYWRKRGAEVVQLGDVRRDDDTDSAYGL